MKEKTQQKKLKINTKNRTYIGGQAVMEGVMMRGKISMACAIRDNEGKIQIESERIDPPESKSRFSRLPFIRGVVNFAQSLILGNRVLLRSAEVAQDEDEITKAEKWLAEKHKINLNGIFNVLAVIVGVILSLGLFVFLPQLIVGFTSLPIVGKESIWYNLVEGGVRILVFIAYILVISLIPSLKRLFMYHGAEHKTITCFERNLPLTIENVKSCPRVHDRCGTTFLFLVMFVSIIVFSFANYLVGGVLYTGNKKADFFIRLIFKLVLLPLVAGVSYEILRGLAKTRSKFFYIFKAPGLLLQRLTTKEPDEGMMACGIAAFEEVLKMDADPKRPESVFAISGKMSELLENTKERFSKLEIDAEEAEWIFSIKLGIAKSAVASEERFLRKAKVKEILKTVDERMTGRPLWYIIGDADFYGYKIKVDERVLIPRRETEELAEHVIAATEDGYRILDLCTGSGAIAIAVAKELEKQNKSVEITAVDISEAALEVAEKNAELNQANIRFVQSDLFSRLRGRFDIIVSNPPYIPSQDIPLLQREVRDFEPKLALDGGEDGLNFYRRISEEASRYLTRGGTVLLEVGISEAEKVVKLFKYCDYAMIIKDMGGVNRFVKIVY